MIERDAKYIIDIKFTKPKLGIVLTSARDGSCAYVTKLDRKNKPLATGKLPENSKLLKVNGDYVEMLRIEEITKKIFKAVRTLPMTLTFCHPNALNSQEVPDTKPKKFHEAN